MLQGDSHTVTFIDGFGYMSLHQAADVKWYNTAYCHAINTYIRHHLDMQYSIVYIYR